MVWRHAKNVDYLGEERTGPNFRQEQIGGDEALVFLLDETRRSENVRSRRLRNARLRRLRGIAKTTLTERFSTVNWQGPRRGRDGKLAERLREEKRNGICTEGGGEPSGLEQKLSQGGGETQGDTALSQRRSLPT